jgi:ketosteroid isomerase-like protein
MTREGASAVQTLLDKQALAELIAVLSAAVDRGDHEQIVSCYAEDSYDDHGSFKGTGREFAEFICAPGVFPPGLVMHHLLGQSVFELQGDDAFGETFFVLHSDFEGASEVAFGRYIDYFRRVDSDWKIAYRRVVPDHTLAADDIARYWRGSRDRHDPRYDRLRQPSAGGPTQGPRPS